MLSLLLARGSYAAYGCGECHIIMSALDVPLCVEKLPTQPMHFCGNGLGYDQACSLGCFPDCRFVSGSCVGGCTNGAPDKCTGDWSTGGSLGAVLHEWGIPMSTPTCVYGKDVSQKQLVRCDSYFKKYICADESGLYYSDTNDCNIMCSSKTISGNICEKGCNANVADECDDKSADSCAGDGHGYCSSTCEYRYCEEDCGAECESNTKCVSDHGSGWTCNDECECKSGSCVPSWGDWKKMDDTCGRYCVDAGWCSPNELCYRKSDGCGHYQYDCFVASSCGGSINYYDVNFYQQGITDGSNWCVKITPSDGGGSSTYCKAMFPSQSWIDHDNIPSGSSYEYNGYPAKWKCTSGCSGTIISGGTRTAYFCAPKDCDSLGKECGIWDDECGILLDCGTCPGNGICVDGVCETPAPCGYQSGFNTAPDSCAGGVWYSSQENGLGACYDYGDMSSCINYCNVYHPGSTASLADDVENGCGYYCGSYAQYCNDCVCNLNLDGEKCGETICRTDCCAGTTLWDYHYSTFDNVGSCERKCSSGFCPSSCDDCIPDQYLCHPDCHCDDEVENCDEEGVDCGGSCPVDCPEDEDYCGNGECGDEEDYTNCCDDCPCPVGYSCVDNVCELICGNGFLDIGEDCESPSTDDNTNCFQEPTLCDDSNRVYCTREDSFGDCDSSCQCVYDSWNCGLADDNDYCSNCDHCGDGNCNCGETFISCPPDGCESCTMQPLEVSISVIMSEEKDVSLSHTISPDPGTIDVFFNPAVIIPPLKNSLMTIVVTDPLTPSGTYTITISGYSEGVTQTATYDLVIP